MAQQVVRIGTVLKVIIIIGLTLGIRTAAAEEGCRIVVLGDSLASAYGLPLVDGFPAQLERRLEAEGIPCTVVDAGVAGDTSAGGLARLDWVLADEPTHVIVELGGNDALRALPPQAMEENLDAIVDRLRALDVEVLIAGMLAPPNLGREYGAEFAAVFPRLAERHDVPLYPFFLEGVATVPDLNQPDGIHPSAQGIATIVDNIFPTVEAWLRDTGAAPARGA